MTLSPAKPWTAMNFRGRIVCYCIEGDTLEARELGGGVALPVTDELRAAVEADRARQARKLEEP